MEQANYSEQEHSKPSTNQNPFPTPKRKRSDHSKRFSDDQVKLLESMFNREVKLEPRNKLQLAKDLGLQPRQVSIWFQNKRARWKSKKLEQEYRVLKANFDALQQQFESLKKENESLLEQVSTTFSPSFSRYLNVIFLISCSFSFISSSWLDKVKGNS